MAGRAVKVLAFDLGVNIGWAFGSTEGDGRIRCGTQRLGPPSSDHSLYAERSMTFLIDMVQVNRPDVLAYEFSQGILAGKQDARRTSIDVIMVHCGLRWMALAVATGMQVRVREYSPQATAKTFLRGQKLAAGERKPAIKRECFIRGIEYGTEHAADAVALWFHAASQASPDFAARDAVARMRMRDPTVGGRAT